MTPDGKNVVRSLAKGFRILEAFRPEEAEMTLSQIATRANLDSGTTYRLINTLLSMGYLTRVNDGRRYRLGLKVLDLGFSAIGGTGIARTARPILRSLLDGVAQSASLDLLDGGDVVRIERVFKNAKKADGGEPLPLRHQGLGLRTRIDLTAIGQAILASRSQTEAAQGTHDSPALTQTLTGNDATASQISQRGYAYVGGKNGEEGYTIAALCFDAHGHPRAVITVGCPNSISSEEFVREYAKQVVHAARRIGKLFDLAGTIAFDKDSRPPGSGGRPV